MDHRLRRRLRQCTGLTRQRGVPHTEKNPAESATSSPSGRIMAARQYRVLMVGTQLSAASTKRSRMPRFIRQAIRRPLSRPGPKPAQTRNRPAPPQCGSTNSRCGAELRRAKLLPAGASVPGLRESAEERISLHLADLASDRCGARIPYALRIAARPDGFRARNRPPIPGIDSGRTHTGALAIAILRGMPCCSQHDWRKVAT